MEKFHIVSKDLKTGEKSLKTNITNDKAVDALIDLTKNNLSNDMKIELFSSAEEVTNIKDLSSISPTLLTRLSLFKPNSQSVFIVHGHNEKILNEVREYIETLKVNTIVMEEKPNGQYTLIEKFEKIIDICRYGIVIYTKCDVGYERSNPMDLEFRARQNVVFEHGYLNGRLSRKNVCVVLESEDIGIPSDIKGVAYIDLSKQNWKQALKNNLIEAGLIKK